MLCINYVSSIIIVVLRYGLADTHSVYLSRGYGGKDVHICVCGLFFQKLWTTKKEDLWGGSLWAQPLFLNIGLMLASLNLKGKCLALVIC